jgi:hypothetical protein
MHSKTEAAVGADPATPPLVKPLLLRDVTNRSSAANSARRLGMIAAAAAGFAQSPRPRASRQRQP